MCNRWNLSFSHNHLLLFIGGSLELPVYFTGCFSVTCLGRQRKLCTYVFTWGYCVGHCVAPVWVTMYVPSRLLCNSHVNYNVFCPCGHRTRPLSDLVLLGGHKFFLWGHWYPCFRLLVTSTLGFKARVDPSLARVLACMQWIPQILFNTC